MQSSFTLAKGLSTQRNIVINARVNLDKYQCNPSDTKPSLAFFQQHIPEYVLKNIGPEGSRVLDRSRFLLKLCPITEGAVLQIQDLQYVSLRGGDQLDFHFENRNVKQIEGALRRLNILGVEKRMEIGGIKSYEAFAVYVVDLVLTLQQIYPGK